jgi:hypothetical protein
MEPEIAEFQKKKFEQIIVRFSFIASFVRPGPKKITRDNAKVN